MLKMKLFISEEIKAGAMLNSQKLRHNFEQVVQKVKQAQVIFSLFQKGMGRLKFDQILNFTTREVQQFFSQMPLIKSELKRFANEENTVILQADSATRAKQITQNLVDYGVDLPIVKSDQILIKKLK